MLLRNLLERLEIPTEMLDEARDAWPGAESLTDEQLDLFVRQRHLQDAALFHPTSPIVQVARLAGANFRLLSWMLSLLSGADDCHGLYFNTGKCSWHSSPSCALPCTSVQVQACS